MLREDTVVQAELEEPTRVVPEPDCTDTVVTQAGLEDAHFGFKFSAKGPGPPP